MRRRLHRKRLVWAGRLALKFSFQVPIVSNKQRYFVHRQAKWKACTNVPGGKDAVY